MFSGSSRFHWELNWTEPTLFTWQTFTLELYFRQYWRDDRLSHNLPKRQITLPGDTADRLWQPDTYFQKTKKGELHKLTTLNKVMVTQQDGSVFISTR